MFREPVHRLNGKECYIIDDYFLMKFEGSEESIFFMTFRVLGLVCGKRDGG